MKFNRIFVLVLLIPVLGFWSLISARAEGVGVPSSIAQIATATPTSDVTQVVSTPEVLGQVTVTGKITHGAGLPVPASLLVYLEEFETTTGNLIWSRQVNTQPDGTYRFENVDLMLNCALVASVDYEQIVFGSENYLVSDLTAGTTVDIPMTIYETSTDGSALVISQLHFIFEETSPGTIQVVEWLQITNPTDKVVVSDGVAPVVRFAVPVDTSNLQFPDGANMQTLNTIDGGFGDWQNILPGTGYQMMFAYDLPNQSSYELILPFDLPVSQVIMMVPTGLLELNSGQLQAGGERTMQNIKVNLYTGGSLPANSELRATVTRAMTTNWLAIGGFTLAGVLLLAALVLLVRQRRMQPQAAYSSAGRQGRTSGSEREKILDLIVALDDKFHAGEVDEETYRSARAELKERLGKMKG
jgi:hypothetical protein